MTGHHDGRPGLQGHAHASQRSADTGVLGDAALLVLRYVEVGSDEDAAAPHLPMVAEIGKTQEFHVGGKGVVPRMGRGTHPRGGGAF